MSTSGRSVIASRRSNNCVAATPDTPRQSYTGDSRLTSRAWIAAPISPTSWLNSRGQTPRTRGAPWEGVAGGRRWTAPMSTQRRSV